MRVRVRTAGDGPPLLLIMGIGGNLDMWNPLLPHVPKRRLIMFDFPGTGGSGMSWLPPSMACNAAFVRSLMRRMGLTGKVDVLGYSWGGILAQHFAFQYPGATRRLILAATTVGMGGFPPSPWVGAQLLTPERYNSRDYFRRVAPRIYGGRYRSDPTMVEAHANNRLGHPPSAAGYASQLTSVTGYSTLPMLPFICARTLILAGDDDPIVPAGNARLMAAAIRRSQLMMLKGSGHLLLIDSSEVIGPAIEDFLSAP